MRMNFDKEHVAVSRWDDEQEEDYKDRKRDKRSPRRKWADDQEELEKELKKKAKDRPRK